MANTSIISTPNLLSPVNSVYGNTFILNNSSSSALNFKYITELWVNGTYSVKELLPPRPISGYGYYSPFKTLLSSLSYDLPQVITTPTESLNGIVRYNIKYGYSFNPNLTITPPVLAVSTASSVFFGFSFSNTTNLTIGDVLTIQSDNPYFSGTSSVIQILTPTSFVINKPFALTSSVGTGYISNATRMDGTFSSLYYGYNGTRQYENVNDNYTNIYLIGNTVSSNIKPFITNSPTYKSIMSGQYETVSALLFTPNFISGGSYSVLSKYNFYNSNNTLISSTSSNFTLTRGATPSIQFWNIPVGPGQLSLPVNTDNYSVTLYFGSTTYSESKFYKIDTNCSLYTNVRVMFMNRYGAFDYFNFRANSSSAYNISRQEFRQELDFNYNIGDRGRTIMSQRVDQTFTLYSDLLSQSEWDWLSELATSPEVYIVNEITNKAIPIIVTDTNYNFKKTITEGPFYFTLNYQNAFGVETQNQ